MKRLLLLALLTLLAGCSRKELLDKFANEEKKKIAQTYIQRVIDGDLANLVRELEPSLARGNPTAALTQVREAIPPGTPSSTELVGYHESQISSGEAHFNLSYQYRYGDKWLLVNSAWLERRDGSRLITGLRAQVLPASLQEIHALSFKRAGKRHYAFAAAVLAVPAFILVTLVACARTPIRRFKWLWMIFIAVGLVRITINWTTGELSWTPLSFQVLGAGAFADGYGPWMVSFALPLGAAIFWLMRRSLRKSATTAATPGAPTA